jgi:hypothetical protein
VQEGRTKIVPLKNTAAEDHSRQAGGQAGRTKIVPLKNTAGRPRKNNAGGQVTTYAFQ